MASLQSGLISSDLNYSSVVGPTGKNTLDNHRNSHGTVIKQAGTLKMASHRFLSNSPPIGQLHSLNSESKK